MTDSDLSIFESGAILLHLGGLSDALLPADPRRRAEAVEWLAGTFSVADILMADTLLLVDRFDGLAGAGRVSGLCGAGDGQAGFREGAW